MGFVLLSSKNIWIHCTILHLTDCVLFRVTYRTCLLQWQSPWSNLAFKWLALGHNVLCQDAFAKLVTSQICIILQVPPVHGCLSDLFRGQTGSGHDHLHAEPSRAPVSVSQGPEPPGGCPPPPPPPTTVC